MTPDQSLVSHTVDSSPFEETRQAQIDVSILIPVKDEVSSLPQLAAEIVAALPESVDADESTFHWEAIFVDDGSTDGSWDEIRKLSAADHRFRGLRLRRNFGKSAALAAGVVASSGRIIATLDGDLQDDPAEIPGMIEKLSPTADLVVGHKANRHDPMSRRIASRVFNTFTSLLTGLRLHDHNCGLKVGRRQVFDSTPLYGEMHRYLAAIGHAQGFGVVEQPVNHRPRSYGSSKFGLERYARGALDLLTVLSLTRYTARPAHLFGGVGMVLGTLGVAVLLYLSGVWLFTDTAIGSRPLLLMGVLLVLVSVQLLSLGVLAEMLINRDLARQDPLRNVSERTEP